VLFMLLTSCVESVYIPDPIDPRLPKYTEVGNNVGGALLNDKLWKSEVIYDFWGSASRIPIIRSYQDSISIAFDGELNDDNYAEISVGLDDITINQLADLTTLSGRKFSLDGNAAVAWLTGLGCGKPSTRGQVYFRSVSYSSEYKSITLSGTFSFVVEDCAGVKVEVTYGRFDFEIFRLN